jgi:cell division transport system permease protein
MSKSNAYSKNSLRTSYITTVIGISIVLLTLGIVTILLLSSRKLQGIAKEQVQIDVFFNDDVPETEIFQLEKVFQSKPFVKSVKFVSSHAALMSMKDAIENDGIELIEGESPIPPSLSFHPTRAYANIDSLKALKTKIESQYSIVDDFDYNERIIQQSN